MDQRIIIIVTQLVGKPKLRLEIAVGLVKLH